MDGSWRAASSQFPRSSPALLVRRGLRVHHTQTVFRGVSPPNHSWPLACCSPLFPAQQGGSSVHCIVHAYIHGCCVVQYPSTDYQAGQLGHGAFGHLSARTILPHSYLWCTLPKYAIYRGSRCFWSVRTAWYTTLPSAVRSRSIPYTHILALFPLYYY